MGYQQVYTVGELFCGPGGMALGAKKSATKTAKIDHVWALDNDENSCKTYSKNLSGKVFCEDVRKFDFKKAPRVDGIVFGFPCNDFSQVGKRKGTNGKYGNLYIHAIRALKTLKPLFFLAENVAGLHSTNKKSDCAEIIRGFKSANYDVFPKLYNLEEHGIPQTRKRIFIVGLRKDLKMSDFIHPQPKGKIVTCRMALEGKPISQSVENNEFTRQSKTVIERLKHIKRGENAFNSNLPDHLRLNVQGATISQIYRRLDPDKPAYTVTGSGGGGTHVYHWKEHRALTNRERARLQTFPDNFTFEGSKESVRSQIGMAVPPQIATKLFKAILKHLHANNVMPSRKNNQG